MAYETLEIEQLGSVCRIWLNRVQARNAQNTSLLDELDDAFRAAASDESIRVVVLAARGPHFSAGHDLKEAQSYRPWPTTEERWDYEARRYFDYCLNIWNHPKPTIAQVQGACMAAGFMVANMCDLVVASDDAAFSDPVAHTLAAAATEVLIHPWVMGLRKAKEMLFTGAKLSAAEAHRIGMVNQVVPLQELDAATLKLAQRIAEAPPFAIRLLKKSLNRTLDMQGFRSALDAHFDTHQLSHASSEYLELKKQGGGVGKALERSKALDRGIPASAA